MKENVSIYNYNRNPVFIVVDDRRSVEIKASKDGIKPAEFVITDRELKYLVNNSNIIQNGYLEFNEQEEEELYSTFKIYDWKEILKHSEIDDIILQPTIEKLEKLLAIDNISIFNRVRDRFFNLKITNDDVISMQVTNLIEGRFKELQNKISKSNIVVKGLKKDLIESEELTYMKKQNEALQKQMVEMQEMQDIMGRMMQQMVQNKTSENTESDVNVEDDVETKLGNNDSEDVTTKIDVKKSEDVKTEKPNTANKPTGRPKSTNK